MSDYTLEQANEQIEKSVGELYRGFYMLRQLGEYKEEYDSMGSLLNMLITDRNYLRKTYNIGIEE